MARVTVEDCVERVPNRFDLVMLAAQRSRELAIGGQLTVDRDNDKNPVVALREIAEETVDIPFLEESLVRGLQKVPEVDEPEEEGDGIGFGAGVLTADAMMGGDSETVALDDLAEAEELAGMPRFEDMGSDDRD